MAVEVEIECRALARSLRWKSRWRSSEGFLTSSITGSRRSKPGVGGRDGDKVGIAQSRDAVFARPPALELVELHCVLGEICLPAGFGNLEARSRPIRPALSGRGLGRGASAAAARGQEG